MPDRKLFLVDTHINQDPSAEQLAEITLMAADLIRRFGIEPKAALVSHSNFGSSDAPSAIKMRRTLALLRERAPTLDVDGELHGDCALDDAMRRQILPSTTLHGDANLLWLPNLHADTTASTLLKTPPGPHDPLRPTL